MILISFTANSALWFPTLILFLLHLMLLSIRVVMKFLLAFHFHVDKLITLLFRQLVLVQLDFFYYVNFCESINPIMD